MELDDIGDGLEPEWETPLAITLTPGTIIETVFSTATAVHTAYESCVDPKLIVFDLTAHDDGSDNYCRYIEQEYVEDDDPDLTWHDWTIELKILEVFVVGHWRSQLRSSPPEWEWCAAEAEKAFTSASALIGKRIRRGLVVEEVAYGPRPPRTHH